MYISRSCSMKLTIIVWSALEKLKGEIGTVYLWPQRHWKAKNHTDLALSKAYNGPCFVVDLHITLLFEFVSTSSFYALNQPSTHITKKKHFPYFNLILKDITSLGYLIFFGVKIVDRTYQQKKQEVEYICFFQIDQTRTNGGALQRIGSVSIWFIIHGNR